MLLQSKVVVLPGLYVWDRVSAIVSLNVEPCSLHLLVT